MQTATTYASAQPFTCMAVCLLTALLSNAARAQPSNDLFSNAIRIGGAEGSISGTTVRATQEAGEPNHALVETSTSAWWRWAAPLSGIAHFDTFGSSHDTVIAAYTGTSVGNLQLQTANDDAHDGTRQSEIGFEVDSGQTYYIAVDGYDGDTGNVRLNWTSAASELCLELPSGPIPADGGEIRSSSVELRWNTERQFAQRIIYGQDDRREVFETLDKQILRAYDGTVALMSRDRIQRQGDGYRLDAGRTFAQEYGMCSSERYANQPIPANCSGFLVAPDLVVTAGHCIETQADCHDVAFVFGFQMLDRDNVRLDYDVNDVYFCQEIVARNLYDWGGDWAVLRLDREVVGHEPVSIRRQGRISNSQNLVMIGHPVGLPAKVATGIVRSNIESSFFVTNLDAYGGNSGSAVFNSDTMEVEGILVRGEPEEFIQRGACYVSRVCPDTGCNGEEVARTTEFDSIIPQTAGTSTYKLWLGTCGKLQLLAETRNTSWTVDNLVASRSYCWRVDEINDCGTIEGQIWGFSTLSSPGYRRGDVAQDGARNLTDAVFILNHLFLGGDAPACEKSADIDDSGAINLSDSIYLLNHLFLGGDAPPAPLEDCGPDPSADALSCASYSGC